MPGNTQAIRAGRAYVELFAKDPGAPGLVKGFKLASARLKAFGVSVTMAGAKLMALGLGAAAQACFIRAGITNEVKEASRRAVD